jgi:hypothetical protein
VAHIPETLKKLKWVVMEYPAHSPDFASSDFHHFGPHKELQEEGSFDMTGT